ncbi:hypothetical protein Hanom_Chr04g00367231 [Helianthus anomalus]
MIILHHQLQKFRRFQLSYGLLVRVERVNGSFGVLFWFLFVSLISRHHHSQPSVTLHQTSTNII